ncbi:transporter substrate-binding domain-containing protein [Nibricoccus aquaticus]|nr:transporter substrate-binding domain-containing protein [Nibricoccus aquaticus]
MPRPLRMASGSQFFRRFHRRILRRFFLWQLVAMFAATSLAQTAPAPEKNSTPLTRIGVFTDNYPFSFTGPSGQPEGFAVDLLAAIERTMGLRLERVTGPTDVITAAFHDYRLEALQSFAQTPARELRADFTVPYLSMAGSIFARKNTPPIRNFADLRGRRVMVHAGSLGEQLLRASGLETSIVHVESVEQALRKLDAGENDATLVSRLTGLATAHQLGLENIAPVGEPVPGYAVRYCFGVQDGDRELLAQLNEGLAILQRTGEFERIYRRWFGHVDPLPGYSALHIALAIAAGLALALAIAIWSFLRQRRLHENIAAQAEALRASEERYRGVFETSQEGLLLLHPAGKTPPDFALEEINQAAANMLGLDRSPPLPGTSLRGLTPCCTDCCDLLGQALARDGASVFEHTTPPGRSTHTALRVSVTRIGPRVLVVLSDLTETRRAEERLRTREQQLRQNQKLEALGTLAGGVAHDFNNILTSILGNADIAGLDLPPGSSVHAQLDEIRAASERARQLVRQILTFTRHAEARCETLCLTPLIEECLRFLRASVRSSITIRHHPAPGAPQIEADATQIHQVIMNLCTNAVHAMGDTTGSLEVTEDILTVTQEIIAQHPQLAPGEFVRIAIRDTGCGMTPEVVQRMFEPFFTTKAPGQGTGLGLSVVHGIMQNHRGAITVYSKPGQGTLFHLYFPLKTRTSSSQPPVFASGAPRGRGQRILFVDDEQPIVRAASQLLTRLGYEISAHHEVTAALAEFEKTPSAFALIVTDLTMPKMTGLEFIQRALALRPELPVVLISGFMNDTDLARARDLGVNRVLDKPLTLSALGRTVSECLNGR